MRGIEVEACSGTTSLFPTALGAAAKASRSSATLLVSDREAPLAPLGVLLGLLRESDGDLVEELVNVLSALCGGLLK
eukprot:CAMPEP_0185909054 /NCGR_PEP_ID=MMETSP0196C-20130402/10775_1 /TAXON_ID=2932 /ORGANISM="Alexandrium fundyense, Strain CCMP1719" /LENGTH=76 /DNA_ID=CAMNT_0028629453 /DNA_START=119 /DNA_END=347 /DNA_ORIENTATION=-